VICKRKRKRIATAAYIQKLERAGRAELVDMAKATKSVREVTVIDVAACAKALLMRVAIGSVRLVWSNAFTITKESSTPKPRMTKGSTE
jgi:hypothetical protein